MKHRKAIRLRLLCKTTLSLNLSRKGGQVPLSIIMRVIAKWIALIIYIVFWLALALMLLLLYSIGKVFTSVINWLIDNLTVVEEWTTSQLDKL